MTEWRPNCTAAVVLRRAELLAGVRSYFAQQSVMAVDTPAFGAASVTDPNIESFRAGHDLWLQTSPEYYMKRLLAAGYPDIYSISRVFRDDESGRCHLPEFTMVEWYRRGFDLSAIVADTCALLQCLLTQHELVANTVVVDYRSVFRDATGLDPLDCGIAQLSDSVDADARLCEALGERRDAWLDLVMATRVTPAFPADRLTVVQHFPARQAALSRLCPNDISVADRFEVFFGPMELANGYVELVDVEELERRMRDDLDLRKALGRRSVPIDRQLIDAMRQGLPPCAGVAMGFERVHMIAENTANIRDVVVFG